MSFPWVDGKLKISASAFAVVEKAAVDAYARDEEACGYIHGPSSEPDLAVDATELQNLANKYHEIDPDAHPRTGHDYFKINALKFERAVESGRAGDQPVKIFFHSHLDCGAYFSKADAARMTMGGQAKPAYPLCYLVTAVDKGEVTAHKLFLFNQETKTFDETEYSRVEG